MGYDTRLVIVKRNKRSRKAMSTDNYMRKEAELEMGCCCYGKIAELISSLRKKNAQHVGISEEIQEFTACHKAIFNAEGNWTEELAALSEAAQHERCATLHKLQRALNKKIPYMYVDDEETYTDSYGDVLLVASVQEIRSAILQDLAASVAKKEYEGLGNGGYRRFNIALDLLNSFKNNFGEDVEVVLYGH